MHQCEFEYRHSRGTAAHVSATTYMQAALKALADDPHHADATVFLRCLTRQGCGHYGAWRVDTTTAQETLVCDHPVPIAPPSNLPPDQGGRRTPPDPADVWLTTIGVVFDEGLNGMRLPQEHWKEFAADVVIRDLQFTRGRSGGLATLRFEEWVAPSAADIAETADALGGLLDLVAEHGVAVFAALTEQNRQALKQATQSMALVHEQVSHALSSS